MTTSNGTSAAGTCISFSNTLPATRATADFAALTWTPGAEIVSAGEAGGTAEVIKYTTLCNGTVNKLIGSKDYGSQALELAFDKSNPAQAILNNSFAQRKKIAVKVSLSNGEDVFYYVATNFNNRVVIGGANDLLKYAAQLEIDGDIVGFSV